MNKAVLTRYTSTLTTSPSSKYKTYVSDLFTEADNGNGVVPSATLENGPSTSFNKFDFTKYEDRLKSYENFPNKEISKEQLAKSGFFYTNCNDIVQCPFCGIEGYQWVAGDDPMDDHRQWKPLCPFVMSSVESSPTRARGTDTCGLYEIEILPNSVPEDEIYLERLGTPGDSKLAHPDKFTLDSRLKTFENWPKSMKQTPEKLADAGFYYVGTGDQTKCFQCGGGLKDWEENDDPWEQHALWFSKCPYVVLKKGSEYIQEVMVKRDPRTPSGPSSSEAKEATEETVGENNSSLSASTLENNKKEDNENLLCRICFQNEREIAFLPCRHIVSCVECSSALITCAVCREPIKSKVRMFLY